MNDLAGLSWNSAPINPTANRNGVQFPIARPAPSPSLPRQPTPLSAQNSGRNTPVIMNSMPGKVTTQDSFSNLLGSTAMKKTNPMSLQERQKQLLEEKARQAAAQQKGHGLDDDQFWEGLGSGRSTPAQGAVGGFSTHAGQSGLLATEAEEDILAAFKASAPVDASSHFPPGLRQEHSLDRVKPPSQNPRGPSSLVASQSFDDDEDDDPFGLGQMSQRPRAAPPPPAAVAYEENDDILGLLGQPAPHAPPRRPPIDDSSDEEVAYDAPVLRKKADPRDAAIAEILDMGFSVSDAREALEHTSSGTDIQTAVGWLLNKAHEESGSRSRTPAGLERDAASRGRGSRTDGRDDQRPRNEAIPPWMKAGAAQKRQDSQSPASSDRDVAQYATEIGSSLFKSANSLLKGAQRKAQKAMAEYQEPDHSQPKWLRPTREEGEQLARRERHAERKRQDDLTNEAMLLESGRSTPVSRPMSRAQYETRPEAPTMPPQRRPSPQISQFDGRIQQHPERQQIPTQPVNRPADRLRKQLVEEESAQAYISPARRKKAAPSAPPPEPKPEAKAQPPAEPELDIFSDFTAPQVPSQHVAALQQSSTTTTRSSTPLSIRPTAPTRQAPPVSSTALTTSTTHRQKGTEAFKRGDYGEAQSLYSAALAPLPSRHPITIILFCNRALTNIKTGDPKAAVADADAALAIIGPSRGDGESISLGATEADKPMKEFFGKALTRKAEAFEHMEKWAEAAGVWREAVEAGVGGNVSIQNRNRCEKASGAPTSSSSQPARPAAASRSATAPAPKRPTKPPASSRTISINGTAPILQGEAEAVTRLRAANAAAAAASDEAFALNDAVEARLSAWKTGKEGNLRALLASLDAVLWAEAGWKKVGMGDLVLPGKVKVVYMKAIAKCHPDKIPQSATTEQRMISASVFAILNEAWDKFKRDNGM